MIHALRFEHERLVHKKKEILFYSCSSWGVHLRIEPRRTYSLYCQTNPIVEAINACILRVRVLRALSMRTKNLTSARPKPAPSVRLYHNCSAPWWLWMNTHTHTGDDNGQGSRSVYRCVTATFIDGFGTFKLTIKSYRANVAALRAKAIDVTDVDG